MSKFNGHFIVANQTISPHFTFTFSEFKIFLVQPWILLLHLLNVSWCTFVIYWLTDFKSIESSWIDFSIILNRKLWKAVNLYTTNKHPHAKWGRERESKKTVRLLQNVLLGCLLFVIGGLLIGILAIVIHNEMMKCQNTGQLK